MDINFLKIYNENKTHLINNLPLLSQEQKSIVSDFFNKHPNLEGKVDWNNKNLKFKDFESIFNTHIEKLQNNHEKLKNFKEGKDYISIPSNSDLEFYIPLTYYFQNFIENSSYGGFEGKWCIGASESNDYWIDYSLGESDLNASIFLDIIDFKNRNKLCIQYEIDSGKMLCWNRQDSSYTIGYKNDILEKNIDLLFSTEEDSSVMEKDKLLLSSIDKSVFIYFFKNATSLKNIIDENIKSLPKSPKKVMSSVEAKLEENYSKYADIGLDTEAIEIRSGLDALNFRKKVNFIRKNGDKYPKIINNSILKFYEILKDELDKYSDYFNYDEHGNISSYKKAYDELYSEIKLIKMRIRVYIPQNILTDSSAKIRLGFFDSRENIINHSELVTENLSNYVKINENYVDEEQLYNFISEIIDTFIEK